MLTDQWFDASHERKHSRREWEGHVFIFWHADKSGDQRDTALNIAALVKTLRGADSGVNARQRQWLESMMYIFNKHWDKVDNFRIDKYLMLVRATMNALFVEMKAGNWSADDLAWYKELVMAVMGAYQKAQGLSLQICDVLVPELGKVDAGVSLEVLGSVLGPFLDTLALSEQKILSDRIVD